MNLCYYSQPTNIWQTVSPNQFFHRMRRLPFKVSDNLSPPVFADSSRTVDGLGDPQLYGPNFSEEILAQFGTKLIGRVESEKSAEWAFR